MRDASANGYTLEGPLPTPPKQDIPCSLYGKGCGLEMIDKQKS